jgi:hypothetical protein
VPGIEREINIMRNGNLARQHAREYQAKQKASGR